MSSESWGCLSLVCYSEHAGLKSPVSGKLGPQEGTGQVLCLRKHYSVAPECWLGTVFLGPDPHCLHVPIPRGRLLHGRHFTYKSITGDMAITFVSTGVEGAFATEEHPYAAHGPWLQVRSILFPFLFFCWLFPYCLPSLPGQLSMASILSWELPLGFRA